MTDLSKEMIGRVLADHHRVELLVYLEKNGRALESELVAMAGGRGKNQQVRETHLPILVDFGILERDGEFIVPTEDVEVVLNSSEGLEAAVTEYATGDPLDRSSHDG